MIFKVLLLGLLWTWPVASVAQELSRQQQIDQAKDLIQLACLSGKSFEFSASVDGDIKLRSLSPSAKGDFNINAKNISGGVGYINEELRKTVDESIRKCMEPYIQKIFDIITGNKSSLNRNEIGRIASIIEDKNLNSINFDMSPDELPKIFATNEINHVSGVDPSLGSGKFDKYYAVYEGKIDRNRTLIFDGQRLMAIYYEAKESTRDPTVDCELPYEIKWRAIQENYQKLRKDITQNLRTERTPRGDVVERVSDDLEMNTVQANYQRSIYFVKTAKNSRYDICSESIYLKRK